MLKIIKDMPFKDKVDYIWTYYKLHIMAIIIVIAITFNILDHFLLNPPPSEYVSIAFLNDQLMVDSTEFIEQALNDKLVTDGQNLTCPVYNFFESDNAEFNMANQVKYMALISTNSINIFIDTKQGFNNDQELYEDLNIYFTQSELDGFAKQIIYDKSKSPIGFTLHKSNFFDNLNIDYEDKIISVIKNNPNYEHTLNTLNLLIGR